ncbi:ATP12 family chaperone protein [Bradyrhizobium sp. 2TAF24]|uniref:ATP12 family chaperone protein n=1 Tax=Bradyrhizobium sp. 2TAF24 TaxID=3233011 RepID=UPI003F917190
MRELFDEVAGQSPLDPNEAARQSSRPQLRKRFYTSAGVVAADGGHAVVLDGRTIRTPAKQPLVAPSQVIAAAIAAEWDAQQDVIDPSSMPLTRLANSVIDGVAPRAAEVADDIAKYFGTDALFYRADHPQALVARQAEHWDPVLFWAAEELGAHFILAEGIMHVRQPDAALAAARAALPQDAWRLGALHVVTTLTGSALLALALLRGRLDAEAVWTAAHVDEDWNIAQWGADEEVISRRAARQIDFRAAALVLA